MGLVTRLFFLPSGQQASISFFFLFTGDYGRRIDFSLSNAGDPHSADGPVRISFTTRKEKGNSMTKTNDGPMKPNNIEYGRQGSFVDRSSFAAADVYKIWKLVYLAQDSASSTSLMAEMERSTPTDAGLDADRSTGGVRESPPSSSPSTLHLLLTIDWNRKEKTLKITLKFSSHVFPFKLRFINIA